MNTEPEVKNDKELGQISAIKNILLEKVSDEDLEEAEKNKEVNNSYKKYKKPNQGTEANDRNKADRSDR